MSKPDKIPIETKKGACYYGIITYSSTGWKSRDKRFVVDWGGRQSHRRQRQRRQTKTEKAKTEKAGKDREGKDREGKDREGKDREGRQRQRRQTKTEKAKKQTGIFRDIRILQRQTGSYRTENQPEIRQAGTLDCYSTCQCPALLMVFLLSGTVSMSESHFFRILPLFEPHHGGTAEQLDTPCWLWICRSSRLNLLFVKSGSDEGVGTMYW